MTLFDGMEPILLLIALLVVVPFLGKYMARVFEGHPPFFVRPLCWVEKAIYRLCGINPSHEMNWKTYAKAVVYFNLVAFLFLFLLSMAQYWLPFNPENFSGLSWPLAFNVGISFMTNTNWQPYAGESTLSYLTHFLGLTVQNFTSAATGNAVLLALIRGIRQHSISLIGNFWVDVTRTIVYLLLPLAFIFSLVLVSQGVIQNFQPYQEAILDTGIQVLPMGPVASQVAIKQLGSNGGGFFNTSSAHPFENPTPLSNFLEIFAILCIPAATIYMYGFMIASRQQSRVILGVIMVLWLAAFAIALYAEWMPNPSLGYNPVLEGKETRLGITNSVLWTISTTSVANGSVNSMLDSLSPLAGGAALFQMLLGEIVFGGIGVGLCGMLMYILLTVFLAGLMVGRSPEYLGKKIEKQEIQWAVVAIIVPCALTLLGASLALVLPSAFSRTTNSGPHGFLEIFYAFASISSNNGSSFEGLHANTNFYNLILGFCMLFSRLAILIPSLAIAGSLSQKTTLVESLGTFKTNTFLFGILLISVILIIGALTFFPALALGPIAEHLLMREGQTF